MSLVSVLSKVALGAIAAKGVGSMMGGNSGSGLAGALSSMMGGSGGGNPLGALAGMLGGGHQQQSGGLASMLGGGQRGGGALGALSGLLGGGGGQQGGGMLAGLLGGAEKTGGLGGLLDSLGGGGQGGGLGAMLNQALQGQEPEPSQAEEEQAALLLKAMIMAAKSDGQIDENEQRKIAEHLGDVSQEELAVVEAAMAAPVDPEGLAGSTPSGMEQQVYLMSLLGIDLDSKSEAQYLDQLAKALNIAPEQANAIHEQVGAPKLYS
ncbi:MAG TPA: tellurite resistance TerB family protein [Gammaproteobacteria bacterium]|nr:tellurite resistance TerB family protein [Gammaproteobacteria bacterium]